jgi:hypothetical protein
MDMPDAWMCQATRTRNLLLDEKQVTLHPDVRPTSPAQSRREARSDNEYKRSGTANVFCALEPKAGSHFTFPTPDRFGFEFAQVEFASSPNMKAF